MIQPDDTVIIRYGRAEMGQGSFTALPQILAEELECDWAFVKPEYASANRNFRENKVYGTLSTGGSRAMREQGQIVQQAGASARERLIAAAANALGRARVRLCSGDEQGHAQADGPHVPVRRARGRGVRDQAREGARAQAARSVQVHRPAACPVGHSAQDQRRGEIRHRSGSAEHGAGRDHQDAGVRRHGEIGRRKRDRGPPRRAAGGEAPERGRGRGRSLLPCAAGARMR